MMKQADTKLIAAAYYRKSSESDERQVQSIPDQKKWAQSVVRDRQIPVLCHLEESMSARHEGRPAFSELLEKVRSGKVNAIMVWDPSRLSRNAEDGAKIISLMDSGKLKQVITASFTYTNTSTERFLLGFLFVESKRYADSLSEVIHRGLESKVEQGIYPEKARIGYMRQLKTGLAIHNPDVMPHIQRAFELYATGKHSNARIGLWLFRQGIKTKTGQPLSPKRVVDFLSDPFYYGCFLWHGDLHQGVHEPAVSKALWDKVQQVRILRGQPKSNWTQDRNFCGLFRCDECGCSFTIEKKKKHLKNGNTLHWTYYRCTKKRSFANCQQPFIREESLIEQCLAKLGEIALPDDWVTPMLAQLDRWEQEEQDSLAGTLLKIDEGIEKVAAKLRRLNELYIEEELDRAEYTARKKPLLNEKVALEARRESYALTGLGYWLAPLRQQINAVWERNLPTAGGDLNELRDFVAEVGSHHRVNSRKVLWDWTPPYAPLSRRGAYIEWWRWRESNPRPQWDSRQRLRPYPVGLAYGPAPPPPSTGGGAGNPISRRASGSEDAASPVRLRYAAAPGPGSGLTGYWLSSSQFKTVVRTYCA
jgi:site-specific DNA recombinase